MPKPTYTTPLDPSVAAEVALLDEDAREYFEERAAIMQFDGGQIRDAAEAAALAETRQYLQRRARQADTP